MIVTSMVEATKLLPELKFPMIALGMSRGHILTGTRLEGDGHYLEFAQGVMMLGGDRYLLLTSITGDDPRREREV